MLEAKIIFYAFSLIGTCLVAFGVTKATIKFNSEQIKELKSEINGVRTYLFETTGRTIYMPRADCEVLRTNCTRQFDALTEAINTNTSRYLEIKEFMGQVKEYMAKHV